MSVLKTHIRNLFLVLAGMRLLAIPAVAQTFTNLYNFTGGSDGANPRARLILSGNTLYGTSMYGGSSGNGTVFVMNTDGTGFTNLYSFSGSDGAEPQAVLVLSGNTLYGTTQNGGSSGNGIIFAINTDGTGFTNLYNFTVLSSNYTNSDGANPHAGLIITGNSRALWGGQ